MPQRLPPHDMIKEPTMMARSMNPDQALFIVDDDPAVRDALSVVFSLEGFDVETFPKRR
jgi:ActR/RegA family two-component response regulator